MKIVEPQVELWKQEPTLEGAWHQIARATRVCYQSKPRKDESDEAFVKRIILKPALIEGNLDDLEHCVFDFDKMHGAMLEHGTIYLTIPNNRAGKDDIDDLIHNKYTEFIDTNDGFTYITTNMRVIVENYLEYLLNDYLSPRTVHISRYTFSVITDIGVTREFNRHRKFSVAEQSTRYCDFSKDKFGSELTYMLPQWFMGSNKIVEEEYKTYAATLESIENSYKKLRKLGWKPEQARQILPLDLKTQAVYTAFVDDWQHFIKLRADNVSGKVHPNMKIIADKIKELFNNK